MFVERCIHKVIKSQKKMKEELAPLQFPFIFSYRQSEKLPRKFSLFLIKERK